MVTRTAAGLPVTRTQTDWLRVTAQPPRTLQKQPAHGAEPAGRHWLRAPRPSPGWPVLNRLPTLASAAPPHEPTAFQVLRRLPATQAEPALRALATLPSLGAGAPLAPAIRRPLETLLDRDFSGVRLHTASVAAMLGAEAFTTGQQIVFAPGRLDLASARGVALLGHELAHVGQPLAFKQQAGAVQAPMDADEQRAQQQEARVQQIMTHGWPVESRMQVRRTGPPAPSPTPRHAADRAVMRADRGQTTPVQRRAAGDAETLPVARLRDVAPAFSAPAAAAGPDIETLARQVYGLLKAPATR